MKGLLFLSRLALICNGLFLLCLVLQRTHDFIGIKDINSLIIILGWFLAPFINFLANAWWLWRVIAKRSVNLPAWLAAINLLFLFLQLFVHFIITS